MEKLVNEKNMVILYPKLAAKIGLNEAIMLQHIHFWLKESKNQRDGRLWVYNTYLSWQEQLPFWSAETIKRVIRRLEKAGYLLSANYNRFKMDKTKWYSINYEKVAELWEKETNSTGKDAPSDQTECHEVEGTFDQALPKSTTNHNSKKEQHQNQSNQSSEEQIALLHSKINDDSQKNINEIKSIVCKVFPNGLRKDWMDSIYKVYDFYSEEISLPAYKRVLKNISENIAGIQKFEKYLEKAVKNELSSKQATKEETPSRKKYIREEMVPRWLKNGDHEHQKDQRMEKDSESRRIKLLEDFRNLNKKEPIGC